MDFSRGNRPAAAPAPAANHPAHPGGRRKHIDWAARTIRIEIFIILTGSALLVAALSLYLGLSGGIATESKKVDTSKYQAVFLNGGVTSGSVSYSTYFGHIKKINDNYVVLDNVYYLTDQQTSQDDKTQASTPQLTKLGCQQLHSPTDEMIINRTQLAFWENIQDSGKVVTAINKYKTQNPNGPDCSSSSSSTSPQTSTPTPAPATPPSTNR